MTTPEFGQIGLVISDPLYPHPRGWRDDLHSRVQHLLVIDGSAHVYAAVRWRGVIPTFQK